MKFRAYYIIVAFILLSLGCKTITSISNDQITSVPTQTQELEESSNFVPIEEPSLLSNLSIKWVTFLGTNASENYISAASSNKEGDLYILKQSTDFSYDGELSLIKIDKNGSQFNIATFPHSQTDTYNNHLAFDNDGNIYITGASAKSWGNPRNPFDSTVHAEKGYSHIKNVFIAKVDKQGTLVWSTFINDFDISPIATDKSGNVLFASFEGNVNTDGGFTLVKVSNEGDIVWEQKYPISAYQMDPVDLSLDANDNIYVTGIKEINEGDENKGFLAKFSKDGKLAWETKFGGIGTLQIIDDSVVDINGNIYIMGSCNANWGEPIVPYTSGYVFAGDDPDGYADYIAKFDNSGNLSWNTFLNGSATYGSTVLDKSQNLLVSGALIDGNIIQIDPNGVVMSTTTVNDENFGYYFISTNNGNYYYVGETYTSFGNPINPMELDYDTFVAYLNLP